MIHPRKVRFFKGQRISKSNLWKEGNISSVVLRICMRTRQFVFENFSPLPTLVNSSCFVKDCFIEKYLSRMDGKQLPKGTVVTETIERKIVIGGDNDSCESIPLQNLSNPPTYSDNPVGNTTNERKNTEPKQLTEELWGDVSLNCLLFDLNR